VIPYERGKETAPVELTTTDQQEADPASAPRDDPERDFVEFVEGRQEALLRFAYLVTGHRQTAEDVVQTALVKTYLAWGRLRDRGALDAYVRRAIVNEHINLLRRPWKRRERPSEALSTPVPETGPEAVAPEDQLDRETKSVLFQLVRGLPPRQRAAVVLRYYEGFTEPQTADVLGCSVGTVKSQTFRALQTLRGRMTDDLHPRGGRQ
jgi:RNA polymerase sigma-70 factor (sigma-E family)